MTIQYSWNFSNCRIIQQFGTFENVIKVIDWKLTANDGKFTTDASGTTEFGPPNPETFIEFTQITKDVLIGWVLEGLSSEDKKSLYDALDKELEKLNRPTLAVVSLPFY
jgi:hypothetical protein